MNEINTDPAACGNNLMIDIESLGCEPNAVVLSAAGMWFDPNNDDPPTISFDVVFDIQSQLDTGRVITGDTIHWWLAQSEAARKAAFGEPTPYAVDRSISIAATLAGTIWANGPDFDCVILANYVKQHQRTYRWPFWKHRCVRTMKNVFADFYDYTKIEKGTQHNALDDCKAQIEIVRTIYKGLAGKQVHLL